MRRPLPAEGHAKGRGPYHFRFGWPQLVPIENIIIIFMVGLCIRQNVILSLFSASCTSDFSRLDGATLLFSPLSFFCHQSWLPSNKGRWCIVKPRPALRRRGSSTQPPPLFFFITINVSRPLHPRRAFILHQWKMSNAFATVATQQHQWPSSLTATSPARPLWLKESAQAAKSASIALLRSSQSLCRILSCLQFCDLSNGGAATSRARRTEQLLLLVSVTRFNVDGCLTPQGRKLLSLRIIASACTVTKPK